MSALATERFLTPNEVARTLRVSRGTVYRYVTAGRLAPVRLHEHGPLRIPTTELERFLAEARSALVGGQKTRARARTREAVASTDEGLPVDPAGGGTREGVSRSMAVKNAGEAENAADLLEDCASSVRADGDEDAARPEQEDEPMTIDVMEAVRRSVAGLAWDEFTGEEMMREDFERLKRSAHCTGELDMGAALALWRDEQAKRYPVPE